MTDRNHAAEIRLTLRDPVRVVRMLNLTKGALKNSQGLSVFCPVHSERTPSCSITVGREGTLSAHCFGCGWQGDLFALVAAVMGLDEKRDFREVMLATAELGGLNQIADELRSDKPRAERPMPADPVAGPEKEYPDPKEVADLWGTSTDVADDPDVARLLGRRYLFPGPALARAARDTPQPWARFQGQPWALAGYRLILPLYAPNGTMASVRAWRVTEGDGPKRLPPAGRRSSGLVLANTAALRWMRAPSHPIKLVIAEGEPDFLSACEAWPEVPIVGIYSGAWTQDFADLVPLCSLVTIRTHDDEAGNKYASQIAKTLSKRAEVRRGI